jgi:hypothetical protein
MLCPSSTLPPLMDAGNCVCTQPHYGGVSGAVSQADAVDPRQRNCCGCCGNPGETNGIVSGSGVLVPNTSIGIKDITDGSANQMMVVEGSEYCYTNPTTRTGRNYCDFGRPHGWPMGGSSTEIMLPGGSYGTSERTFNITTIRYPVNYNWFGQPGIGYNHGANQPILSGHPAGALVAIADGTVRFLGESTSLTLLKRLAIRDDGNPVGQNY